MKLNYKSYPTFNRHRIFFASILFLALTATVNIRAQSDDEKSVADNVKPEDIIASARANNIDTFEKVSGNFATQRKALGAELVNLLKNTKSFQIKQAKITND